VHDPRFSQARPDRNWTWIEQLDGANGRDKPGPARDVDQRCENACCRCRDVGLDPDVHRYHPVGPSNQPETTAAEAGHCLGRAIGINRMHRE
jgi:hypothetical protein